MGAHLSVLTFPRSRCGSALGTPPHDRPETRLRIGHACGNKERLSCSADMVLGAINAEHAVDAVYYGTLTSSFLINRPTLVQPARKASQGATSSPPDRISGTAKSAQTMGTLGSGSAAGYAEDVRVFSWGGKHLSFSAVRKLCPHVHTRDCRTPEQSVGPGREKSRPTSPDQPQTSRKSSVSTRSPSIRQAYTSERRRARKHLYLAPRSASHSCGPTRDCHPRTEQ